MLFLSNYNGPGLHYASSIPITVFVEKKLMGVALSVLSSCEISFINVGIRSCFDVLLQAVFHCFVLWFLTSYALVK